MPKIEKRNGRAKLDATTVQIIDRLVSQGWSQLRIANLMGLHRSQVGRAANRTTWKHVGREAIDEADHS